MSGTQRKRLRAKRKAQEREAGPLALKIAHGADALAGAFRIYLALEAAGWKGRAGTALARDAAGRAYVEDVLLSLAEAEGAFAAVMSAGAEPVAAGLFLRAGGEAVFWKTAYDERFARHSPGVLFDLALTDWLYGQRWFERLDAGHDDSVDPDGLVWKQRRRMADILIDLAPGSAQGRLAVAGLRLRRLLRDWNRRYVAK
jgi:CelD/BcsL family acetyltransferase involved in cellulose biosynthesis